jgi:hypothetical protein
MWTARSRLTAQAAIWVWARTDGQLGKQANCQVTATLSFAYRLLSASAVDRYVRLR